MRRAAPLAGILAAGIALATACGDFGQEPSKADAAPGGTLPVDLEVGTHLLVLTVTDDNGLTGRDDVTVIVAPLQSEAPVAPSDPAAVRVAAFPEQHAWLQKVNSGISGYSGRNTVICSSECHLAPNGAAPGLRLQGPSTLLPGETGTYRLTLDPTEPTDQEGGGLDVAADGGTLLSIPGQETQVMNGEITHRSPKLGSNLVTWDFRWQAPAAPGAYRMSAAAVSANLRDRDFGDEVGVTTYPITVQSIVSHAPTAAAGPDQAVIDTDADGLETVALDGSGSGDVDGKLAAWEWRTGGNSIATGETVDVDFGVGSLTLTLVVTDDSGLTASDEATIVVAPVGQQPPIAVAGPDRTVLDTDGNGRETVLLDSSASADSDGTIVSRVWSEDGEPIGGTQRVGHRYGRSPRSPSTSAALEAANTGGP